MDDPAQRRQLDEIEQQIASNRARYLHATWKAQNDNLPEVERVEAAEEAETCERTVNRLLGEWDDVRCGRKAAT